MLRSTMASVLKLPGMAHKRCRSPRTDSGALGFDPISETQVRDRLVAVPVEDQARHLAVADGEDVGGLGRYLPTLDPAPLAPPLVPQKDKDTIVIELAKLIGNCTQVHPCPQHRRPDLRH